MTKIALVLVALLVLAAPYFYGRMGPATYVGIARSSARLPLRVLGVRTTVALEEDVVHHLPGDPPPPGIARHTRGLGEIIDRAYETGTGTEYGVLNVYLRGLARAAVVVTLRLVTAIGLALVVLAGEAILLLRIRPAQTASRTYEFPTGEDLVVEDEPRGFPWIPTILLALVVAFLPYPLTPSWMTAILAAGTLPGLVLARQEAVK